MINKIWTTVGKPEHRIDALEKAMGRVKFMADYSAPGLLHAKLVTSTEAHALIKSIDKTEAWKMPGVRAIVTGDMFPFHIGPILADRPPLAFEKVRYYGEPIAIVVADHEHQAKAAAQKVLIKYETFARSQFCPTSFSNQLPSSP